MVLLLTLLTAATAWAQTTESVNYIDENGATQTVTATVLTGSDQASITNLGTNDQTTWYVVKNSKDGVDAAYVYKIYCYGSVNIILEDGAEMTVSNGGQWTAIWGGSDSPITIYGQTLGTGRLSITGTECTGISANDAVNICGGTVSVVLTISTYQAQNAISSSNGNVTISRGTVTADAGNGYAGINATYGNVEITGGNVTATGGDSGICSGQGNIAINGGNVTATGGFSGINARDGSGTITLGWTRATDRIYANNYSGTVAVAPGLAFLTDDNPAQKVSGDVTDLTTINGKTLSPDLSTAYTVSADGNTYTINNAMGWAAFCDLIEDGESFSGKTVKLGADITVTRIAGSGAGGNLTSNDHPFCGTFDGDGKTLTFNYGSSGSPANENNIAPFRYVNGATIQHLHVAGNIYTQHVHAGGIVGMAYGTTNITDCHSSVNIISSINGDGTHGGIMSCSWTGSTTNITGCLFDGSIQSATGYTTNQCGGFVGWRNATINVTNSLLTADLSTIATPGGLDYPSATFVRNGEANRITNSYYVTALGTAQGTAATPTSNKPSNLGAQKAVYSVSGLSAYENGLYRGGYYYCGTPEYNPTLTATSATIFGEKKFVTTFYHGTLNYQLPEGALAYTASLDDGKVVFHRIGEDSRVIPKNTAVIIVSDNESITFTPLSSTTVTPHTGNILQGSDEAIDKPSSGTVYVLNIENKTLGFYPFKGDKIPAGKAYYYVAQ